MADLHIIGQGTWFSVKRGDQVVADRFTSHGNAVAALPGIEARLRPVTIRDCLCCRTPFKSMGKGHRLCRNCQRNS
jgi:hypothetical protein